MLDSSAQGTVFLVVGPSGAGKDTLLDGARSVLSAGGQYHFARRTITRIRQASGENHVEVSPAEFDRLATLNAFALQWGAHDLQYGIPHAELAPLQSGVHVVANGSRGVLDKTRAIFPNVVIVSVIVPMPVLRSRLEARGREDAADIERRLARAESLEVFGPDVRYVVNDGSVDEGVARFLDVLGCVTA